jgi:hypothetical protein
MDSRELVKKTLDFDKPERIPRQLWYLSWASMNYPQELQRIQQNFPDDIVRCSGFRKIQPPTKGKPYVIGEYTDEWGCVFQTCQPGVSGEVKEPLLSNWEDLEKLREPVEMLEIDIKEINNFCHNTDKFVQSGCCPRPFERIQFIRGIENVLIDLALESSELFTLLDRVHQFYLAEMQVWVQTSIDGFIFMDDWGSQNELLISPDMWRRYFKPIYKKYIDIAHNAEFFFMYSDDFIIDIIEDLIEIGLDALNSQIFCMGIKDLGELFSGRITFWGEIDRQHLLTEASAIEVVKAIRNIYSNLYKNGGVIAQMEFGPGAKPENIFSAFEEWEHFSVSES